MNNLLKKKTEQLGGKGTFRRKIKRIKGKTIDPKKNLKDYIDNLVKQLNIKILNLNNNQYSKFRDFVDEMLEDYLVDLKRDYIDKSNGLKYSDINIEGKAFFYKNIFYPVDETKILVKSDVYNYINNNFKEQGKNLMFTLLDSIDKILVKKEYNVDLESDIYKEDEFNRALEYFDIDKDDKVHFKQIREKYKDFIEQDASKENTEMYYKLLRNQYENYLSSKETP